MTGYSQWDADVLDALINHLSPSELRNELRYQAGLKTTRHVPREFAHLYDRAVAAKVQHRNRRTLGSLNRADRR